MRDYKFSKSFYVIVIAIVPLVLVVVINQYHQRTIREQKGDCANVTGNLQPYWGLRSHSAGLWLIVSTVGLHRSGHS